MEVRRAAPGDVPDLAVLLGQLGYPVEPDRLERRMQRLPAGTTVFVAAEPAIVGFAALDVRQGLQHETPAARIIAFVVRDDARRRGIARRLLAAVEDAARAAGCDHVHVTSAHRRADAHAAYLALGFADTGRRFGKDLRGGAPACVT
jgi:GNAT superfamily N-acetyltransferase